MQTEIRDAFVQHLTVTKPHLQDQIKAIVLTKGVPTRVSNSGGSGTNISAAWRSGPAIKSKSA